MQSGFRRQQSTKQVMMLGVCALLSACSTVTLTPAINTASALTGTTSWTDSYQSRLEVLALMQSLNASILGSTSATASLQQWCADHHMAAEPRISARLISGAANPATAEQLQRLNVKSSSELKYRLVELRCGEHILSVAENWYVPARLTADMNKLLDNTDTPFGKAVLPLAPFRRTFDVKLLWSPLAQGWELAPGAAHQSARKPQRALAIPAELFSHRAVLYSKDNLPIAEVNERYQGALLLFKR